MQSTLKAKSKTHPGMLPQFQALKVSFDGPAKVKADASETDLRERSPQASLAADQADFQHGRGECPKGPSPSLQREEKSGVIRVFVTASDGMPLMPCHAARARQLLKEGRARIHKLYPFTIRLTDRRDGVKQPVVFKLDPGASKTGIALNRQDINNSTKQTVIHLAELTHRGMQIRNVMAQRRGYRRRRRNANLRYRAPRFQNRKRKDGWLPPSLQSRVDNIASRFNRYSKLVPINYVEIESVRFDTQAMENPEISGKGYQQGTLFNYELREYLLEKWGRKCAYCDATNVPLQIEHIVPRNPRNRFAQRGSDRPNNLTLACDRCNKAKGNNSIEKFLVDQPDRLRHILAHTRKSFGAAAAVNSTRNAVFRQLREASALPVAGFSGGRTKFNRLHLSLPKTHALDAACVGEVSQLSDWNCPVLQIKATGRGSYQRTRVTKDGFPRGYLPRSKSVHGFHTGDLVKAIVPSGKKAGTYFGRVAVRSSGSFNIQTNVRTIQGVNYRFCRRLQAGDGYTYYQTTAKPVYVQR
jgi:5-methylcytosine-specific restriction endonuclease McrA